MKKLFLIFGISFLLFYPSLSTFFTNDDFFLLKISQLGSLSSFLHFFDFTKGPEGLGFYRPLTTQVFYFLGWVFKLNPLPLHIISFVTFFAVTYLVYRLASELSKNQFVAFISAFLYATSATHFGHLYYLATYQELGLTLFYLLSTLLFIKERYFWSLGFFVLALLSKETAVVLPLTHFLLLWYSGHTKKIKSLLPFSGILGVYLYLHTFHYGFASGDSYIWSFSPIKTVNTLFWYILWSLNLPEMLVDFVGPGFKFNPNLFKFWGNQIKPIFVLFVSQLVLLFYFLFQVKIKKLKSVLVFGSLWFFITLLPVLFLPLHKFTFYLTLPLFGFVLSLAYLLNLVKSKFLVFLFLFIFLILSVLTLRLTYETHWITRGAQTAKNVYGFFEESKEDFIGKTVYFYDTSADTDLSWSPTAALKVVLSDNNFFEVFYNGGIRAIFSEGSGEVVSLKSRQFLGY